MTRILVVEDNPGDVRLIREALRAVGLDFEIEHCDTADAGVRAARSYDVLSSKLPDLILLDYNLPAGTARDVLLAIGQNPVLTNVKKAVLTCSVAPKDREQALAAGADLFIYKPSDLDEFLHNVGTAVMSLLREQPVRT